MQFCHLAARICWDVCYYMSRITPMSECRGHFQLCRFFLPRYELYIYNYIHCNFFVPWQDKKFFTPSAMCSLTIYLHNWHCVIQDKVRVSFKTSQPTILKIFYSLILSFNPISVNPIVFLIHQSDSPLV